MAAESQPVSGRFLANVNVIFFTQLGNYALQFLLNIILARGLGPAQRGDYALFVLATTIVASLSSLGIGLGTIYYLSKEKHSIKTLLGNSQALVLAVGALAIIVLLIIGLVFEPKAVVEGKSFWLYALAFPLVLEFLLVTMILMGSERFLAMNMAMISQTLIAVIGLGILYVGDWLTLFSALFVWAASYIASTFIALAFIGLHHLSLKATLRPDIPVFRDQLTLGLPGQAGNVLQFLNYRLDQFLVGALRTRAEVGYYAVAVGLSESVWWVSNAVSMTLMPNLTRMGSERAREVTPVACRNTLLVSAIAAAAIAIASPFAVEILFGDSFSPSVNPILWLMPGVVALGGAKVLSAYAFSQAKLIVNSAIALVSLVATLIFDVLLIPRFGISGAAAASSLAYCLSFLLYLYYYERQSGNSALSCIVLNKSDLQLYIDLAKRLWSRYESIARARSFEASDRR